MAHNRNLRVRSSAAAFAGVAWLAVVLLLAGLTGCVDRSEAERLADSGVKTANTLAAYYESLAQDVTDTWELEAFNGFLRGIPLDERAGQDLATTIDALNRRALLARRLAAAYEALKQLASYDASAQVKAAAGNLGDAMTGLPPLKGSNPSPILSSVAADLTAWKQSRDIHRATTLLVGPLEKTHQLFDKEIPLYRSIAEERGNKVAVVADFLITNKMVAALPLLQKVPDALGLSFTGGGSAADDPKTIQAIAALARVRLQRMASLSAGAADGTSQSLAHLVASQQEFLAKRRPSLAEVEAGLQKAQSYLDEIAKLRTQKK